MRLERGAVLAFETRHQGLGDQATACVVERLEGAAFSGDGALYLELQQGWRGLRVDL